MIVFDNIFETKPDYINEQGVKWWYDKKITKYAEELGLHGVFVFFTEETNGDKNRVIIDRNKVVYASPVLEAVCCHLDVMKLARNNKEE